MQIGTSYAMSNHQIVSSQRYDISRSTAAYHEGTEHRDTVNISAEAQEQLLRDEHTISGFSIDQVIGSRELSAVNEMYSAIGTPVSERLSGMRPVDPLKAQLALDKHIASKTGEPMPEFGGEYLRKLLKQSQSAEVSNGLRSAYLERALDFVETV